MEVTQRAGSGISYSDIPKPTDAEMQNEYNYILAEEVRSWFLIQRC